MTKAVIFDLDGTLIDSAPDIHAAANKVMMHRGIAPFTLEEARSFVGHGALVFIERCLAARGRQAETALRDQLLADFLALYESAVHLTKLYPGVASCLDTLTKDALPMAICTNKPEGPTQAVLSHLGIDQKFEVIIGGDTTPKRKPDPLPLLETIARMKATQVVFVGDSEVDSETARHAGVPFALYTEGYRKTPVDQLHHDAAFDNFAELPALVQRLLS
ncbi:phosphoglycolate phosphatase [Roseovarius rhodophyticola]|uniref:Phosphoglycolate phosphatase n=1 Tax=Roseovarius rhodophyticola TaxID=3080827 RepID=A0ABZ2TJ94_9RHOB|nr:phosphoglycolate phosphatase [Roseovarius sp. W115]MDV2929467.1 phosphoglycolate phosphatase [Roseovarius sp. W115]